MANPENKLSLRTLFKGTAAAVGGAGAMLAGKYLEGAVDRSAAPDMWDGKELDLDFQCPTFVIVADIHTGVTDRDTQANTQTIPTLINTVKHLASYPFKLAIHAGDAINETADFMVNEHLYRQTMDALQPFAPILINVLGNHDRWGLTGAQLQGIIALYGLPRRGVKEFDGFQVVWLDLEAEPHRIGYIPKETLEWFGDTIDSHLPAIVVSHYPSEAPDTSGNRYFHRMSPYATYANTEEVSKAFASKNVVLELAGHTHEDLQWQVGFRHIVTIPSFSEKLFSTPICPGSYSILQVKNPYHYVLSHYFGSNRYARREIRIE